MSLEVWADKVFKTTHKAHPRLPIEDIEMEAVNVFCSGLLEKDIAQILLCQNFKRVSEAHSFYRRAAHSKRAVHGEHAEPCSRPTVSRVTDDETVHINQVDAWQTSAIRDLQVAMARMRSESLANQNLIIQKLDEVCFLLKQRNSRSDDRSPSRTTFRPVDRSPSRSYRPSDQNSSQGHKPGSHSPSKAPRTANQSPSKTAGQTTRSPIRSKPSDDYRSSSRREPSPSRDKVCYNCQGRGHFQDVCPSRHVRSVDFADAYVPDDLNSSGSD